MPEGHYNDVSPVWDDAVTGGVPEGAIVSFPAAVVRAPGRPASPAPVQTGYGPPEAAHHNLPSRLSSFVGRERELAEIARLLDTTRLLTLIGTPGVGKTRLAVEVAESVMSHFPAGVWLVELAPVADPGMVPQAIARTLGARERPGRSASDTLIDVLRSHRTLLVLDNCEHVVDACAGLADRLLRSCPELAVLATSREPLGVAGETAWRVPSLAFPNERLPTVGTGDAADLDQFEAVRLFVERAQAARPGFALTPDNWPAITRICRRLDGIPLALELSAARVTALTIEQIADRLDDRFRLLTSGSRTALPRQRTLRATVDWSHDLLSEGERVLLRRLAVFAGGWRLEAAETVCVGDDLEPAEVLDLLQYLVDRSLVVAEGREDGTNRFRMLEMLQQYALERLVACGEADAVRRQHALCFMALAEEAQVELRGPHEGEWSARLEEEIDNLRAALRWAIERGEAEIALRLGGALWRFWTQRGHLVEGLVWLEQALALPGASAHSSSDEIVRARAGALNGAGNVAAARGEHARAAPLHEESLALRRWLGDTTGVAISLLNLGTAARNLGNPAVAHARFDEGLRLFRRLGDTRNEALSFLNLGRLSHDEGDFARALTLYNEGLALFQAVGSAHGIATAFNRMGDLARDRGDLAAAEKLHGEALALRRGRGDPWVMGLSLTGLARVAAGRQDHARTMALAAQSLRALHEAGASRDTATALVVMATAAASSGQVEVGARLLGAVAQAYPEGSAIPSEQSSFEQACAAAQAALSEQDFEAAWAAGQQLSIDQAVDLALTLEESTRTPAGQTTGQPEPQPGSTLTRREREVVALIARGLTNRQIADELIISEWTADSHVRHILNKLNFRSRAQVAAWATEHGLTLPSAE